MAGFDEYLAMHLSRIILPTDINPIVEKIYSMVEIEF